MIIQLSKTKQGMLLCLKDYTRATPEQIKALVEGVTQSFSLVDDCSDCIDKDSAAHQTNPKLDEILKI